MSATNVTDTTKRKRHLAATFGRIVGRHFFFFRQATSRSSVTEVSHAHPLNTR